MGLIMPNAEQLFYFISFHLPNIEPTNDMRLKLLNGIPLIVFDNNRKSKMESTSNIASGIYIQSKMMHIKNIISTLIPDSCCYVNIISFLFFSKL